MRCVYCAAEWSDQMHKLFQSFRYAWAGVRQCFFEERNFKIHTLAAVLAIGAGLFFRLPVSQIAAVLLAIALVMGAEIFNTAIENTLDLICGEYNEKVKKVKDIAAGAVLICAIVAAVIGLMVFLPPFLKWVGAL